MDAQKRPVIGSAPPLKAEVVGQHLLVGNSPSLFPTSLSRPTLTLLVGPLALDLASPKAISIDSSDTTRRSNDLLDFLHDDHGYETVEWFLKHEVCLPNEKVSFDI